MLIAEGADFNHVSEGGQTVTSAASSHKHAKFLELLRRHGATLPMKPPIIVNEGGSIHRTGALDVFETIAALEAYLEPWYADEPHFIFDSEGVQLEIMPTRDGVHLVPKEPRTIDPDIARIYFAAFLKSIARSKGWDFVGVTEAFVETAALPDLARASAKFATRSRAPGILSRLTAIAAFIAIMPIVIFGMYAGLALADIRTYSVFLLGVGLSALIGFRVLRADMNVIVSVIGATVIAGLVAFVSLVLILNFLGS